MRTGPKYLLKEEIAFSYALYFQLLLVSSFLTGCIGFFMGVGISALYFPFSLLISSILFIYQAKKTIPFAEIFRHLLFIKLFLLASFFICTSFLDTTFDGLWYHQPAIVKLAEGWNPVKDPFYLTTAYDKTNYLSIQHFPKASWVIASGIYKTTGLVESGKIINYITVAAVFFYAYALFLRLFKGRLLNTVIFSLLVSLSPVATSQLLSNYVDGMLGGMLSLVLISLISLEMGDKRFKKWNWFIFLSSMVIVTNLKFTGLFMAGIITAVFSMYWWWKKEPVKLIVKKYVLIGAVAVAALVVFGYNPYFTNWHYKGHVFYPLNVKEKDTVFEENEPMILRGRSSASKLFISIFSKPVNTIQTNEIAWKNPVTLTKDEIKVFAGTDVRLGGLGPLFLLGFLLSIPACLLILRNMDKDRRALLGFSLAAILLSVVLVPVAWWARYTPQFFLFPVLMIAFSISNGEVQQNKLKRFLPAAAIIILCLNFLLIAAPNLAGNIMKTRLIKKEMNELKLRKTPLLINFSKTEFQVLRTRLKEAGINYSDCDTLHTNVRELRFIYKLYGYGPVYNVGE